MCYIACYYLQVGSKKFINLVLSFSKVVDLTNLAQPSHIQASQHCQPHPCKTYKMIMLFTNLCFSPT